VLQPVVWYSQLLTRQLFTVC